MGWFSNLCSAAKSVVSAAVSAVTTTVSTAVRAVSTAVTTVVTTVDDWWHERKEEYERRKLALDSQKRDNSEEVERLKSYHNSNVSRLDAEISSAERRLRDQKENNQKVLRQHEENIERMKVEGETRIKKLKEQKQAELSSMKNATKAELAEMEAKYEKEFEISMKKSREERDRQQAEMEKIREKQRQEQVKLEKEHEDVMKKRLEEVENFEKTQETMIKKHTELVNESLKELQEMKLELLELQRKYIKEENTRKLEIITQHVQLNSEYLFNDWNKKLISEFQNEVVISISQANHVLGLFLANIKGIDANNIDEDMLFISLEVFRDWKLKSKEAATLILQFQKQMNDFQGADNQLKSEMNGTLEKYEIWKTELGRIPMKIEIAFKKNRIAEIHGFLEILEEYVDCVNRLLIEMQSICIKPGNFQAIMME